jgi:PAS domain S-box-containing protein
MRPLFLTPGPDRALRRVLDAVDPPRVRRPRLHLAVVALLFAAVSALKVTGLLTPAEAPSVLFVAPIAVAAVTLGARGGLGAAVVAIALLGGSELVADQHLSPVGLATRAAVFVVCGASLGIAIERRRAGDEVMRCLSFGLAELGDALVVLDEHAWTILHASPAAAAIYRRPAESLRGMNVGELADVSDRPRVEERRRMRSAGHRVPARGEYGVRGPAGERLRLEIATMPARLEGRRLWIAVVRDVTSRREAERRLDADHRFLRTVLDTAATPIAVLDAEGRVVLANSAAEELAGMGAALLQGRTPWELQLIDRAEVAGAVDALRAGAGPVRHVAAWRAPHGGAERTIAWTATAVRDDEERLVHAVCIGLDVTAQRAAEHRARSAHAALELSSRELERAHRELGRFVAEASRDLRDPLQAAAGSLDHVEARDDRGRAGLARAGEALARLEARLDALGDFGRLAPGSGGDFWADGALGADRVAAGGEAR